MRRRSRQAPHRASGVCLACTQHSRAMRSCSSTNNERKKTTHLALGELLSSHVLHHLLDALVRAELEEGGRSEASTGLRLLLRRKRGWLIFVNDVSLSQGRPGRGLFIDFLVLVIFLLDTRRCVHARAHSFFCIQSADRRH